MILRRTILAAGAASALLPSIWLKSEAHVRNLARALLKPKSLIPTTPTDRLRGVMRLYAGLLGKCVFTNEGINYGKSDGKMTKPLYGFLAVLEVRVAEVEPGLFRTEQKEALVCMDLNTRMPLQNMVNPYMGEKLIPVGYVSPNNVYFFDFTGSYTRALPVERSGLKRQD